MLVIPAIDLLEGNVVRLVRGNPDNKVIYGNDPVQIAKKWENAGADMLHVVDLDATLQTGRNNTEIVSRIINEVDIPVEVAGGIRTIPAAKEFFSKNAAKVVIGTMAYKNPDSIKQIARKNQDRVVISLDQSNGIVMVDGWKEATGSGVIESLTLFMSMGVREFLLTSVERDGTMSGPDIPTLSSAASIASAKIIASGGVSSVEDAIRVKNIGCSGVILGKALYEGKIHIERVKAIS